MFIASAILASLLNPNWHWFFIVAMCMGFIEYFYKDTDNKDNESSKGGGAAGW